MPNLSDWMGDAHDLTRPKALETAKALRKRQAAVDSAVASRGIPQTGQGNIFQRRRAGMEGIVDRAGR